jgi:hypothetical protein
VSSILDALRKLEEPAPSATGGRPGSTGRRRTAPFAALAIVVAFVAGVGAAFWYRGGRPPHDARERVVAAAPQASRPTDEPAAAPAAPRASAPPAASSAPHATPPSTAASSTPPAEPAVVAVPPTAPPAAVVPAPSGPPATNVVAALAPAPPAPPPPPSDVSELPRARVIDAPAPAARRPEPANEPTPARTAERPALRPAETAAPVETAAVRPPEAPPPPPADEAVAAKPPDGAPQVIVNFLAWSRAPDRRTVALTIGNAGMVTLHEGESASDLEVARILPDRVHVRWGGRLYAVRATP